MDYYNFNSGFTDSLEFLSQAAQKNPRLSHRVCIPEYNCGDNLVYNRKQYRKRECLDKACQKPSSASLILKRTRGREVPDQNSFENIRYRPSNPAQNTKHQPLIRVTVIPNKNTYTQPKLRKRKTSIKKIQSTVSNHESFFKAQNIFLVVGNNKREKIYEIKTTGSEYSNGTRYAKHEEISLEKNFQQLLNSLNMDKKKKKDKVKGKKEKDKKKVENDIIDDQGSGASLLNKIDFTSPTGSVLKNCVCPPAIDTVSPRKSRVTITGKIGLTEDDRYVLRCNATIDGKPVESNFYQEQNVRPLNDWKDQETGSQEMTEMPNRNSFCRCISPNPKERISYCQRETVTDREAFKVPQRDEVVQTAFQFEDSYRQVPCPAYMKPCPAFAPPCPAFRSVETQYCPRNVNAVCFSNVEKLNIYSSRDQVVQCNCPPDLLAATKEIGIEADYEINSPQSCSNPLVIISVYPKQDADDKYTDETSSTKETDSKPALKDKSGSNKKGEKGGKKKQDKKPRPGSPTPPKSPVKGKEEKKVEKTKDKGKDKPDKNKQAKGNNKKGPKKDKPEKQQKEKVETGMRSPEKQKSDKEFGISFSRCAECCMGCTGSRNRPNNQDKTQFNTKRAMNWVSAKNDVSNVSINIDGENEFYDVLLRQGNITTDVQVRTTAKGAKFAQGPVDSGSLENFLLVAGDRTRTRNRSFSQTNFDDQQNADNTEVMDQNVPRLNVRDSIEICHRREEKQSCNSVTFTTSASSASSSGPKVNIGVGMKHFKGDDCKLSNPVARDKEIRELLGIEKVKSKPQGTYQEFAAKAEMDYNCSLHCFYRRQCKTNISTINNIQELRQLYTDDEVTLARHKYLDNDFDNSSDYNNDIYEKHDSILGNNNGTIGQNLEHPPVLYGCKLGSRCPNKYTICGENLKSSKPFVEVPSNISDDNIHKQSKYEKVSVSQNEKSCGVIVQCPYRQPKDECFSNEELKEESIEEEEVKPEISAEEGTSDEQKTNQNGPLYQQIVLNRNINIYLQIEQFKKEKPIILSHKQYNKVKRTIESATAKRSSKMRMCICKQNGEMRVKLSEKKKISDEANLDKIPSMNKETEKSVNSMSEKSVEKEKKESKSLKKIRGKVTCECNLANKNEESLGEYKCNEQDLGKGKCSRQKIATFYDHSDDCCTSNYDFKSKVLSHRQKVRTEVLYMPSRTFVLDAHNNEILTQTNQSKQSKNPAMKSKTRNSDNSERKSLEKNLGNDNQCLFTTPKSHEDDLDEERVVRKTKPTRLDNENVRKFVGEQSMKTKKIKIKKDNTFVSENKQSRKAKLFGCNHEIGQYQESQKTLLQKVKRSKHFSYKDKTSKKNKNDAKIKSNQADEVLENKEYWKGDYNDSVHKTPQPVYHREEQETLTADVPQDQFCRRCGRLKPLNYSGTGKRNNRRLQTCYCSELREEKPDPSVENIFLNNCAKDKRYAASSTEVRYASVIYTNYKHVTFSSTNFTDYDVPIDEPTTATPSLKDSHSIHTIFKRRRRSPTPNLGTSAYSLCSKYTDATTAAEAGTPREPVQERKPFLRRLMSCLVMRSKTSGVKINVKPTPRWNSGTSSVDSYHINTSLGAIELSSSIYDTSASFYSNHSIRPISSKIIKRGFLSSVRGFLTNRRV